jgi:acyl-CoA thioester hydrolase
MTEFAYTTTVDVRYQDHDTMGHVNNAIYVTYMEQARSGYLMDALGVPLDELSMVVANLEVDFRRPVQFAREVEVAAAVTDVGNTSFTMVYEVRDDEGVAVEGETTQVALDPGTGDPRSVPQGWRDAIAELEG